jgi:hypothetical protein
MGRLSIAFLFGVLSIPAVAQDVASCREFVQQFLAWYVPAAAKGSFDVAMERKPELFSPALLKALKDDAAARKRVSDDIVGLDFDPYLGTQDPSRRYEGRGGEVKDKTCTVEIAPAEAKKSGMAAVLAELVWDGTRWRFANFRYPKEKANLMEILAQLRREREKQR